MSARIGVCTTNTVFLLTDAATVRSDNGMLHDIHGKQSWVIPHGPQGIVAWTGWAPPCAKFIRQARRTCASFDALIDAAPYLWRDVRLAMPPSGAPNEADSATDAFCARFGSEPDAFDPRRDGIAFMEQMRRLTRQFEQGPPRHVVGGYVECSRVTRNGAVKSIIHAWPDRIGEPIILEEAF